MRTLMIRVGTGIRPIVDAFTPRAGAIRDPADTPEIKALFVADGANALVLLSADTCEINCAEASVVRQAVGAALSIAETAVHIYVTHMHSSGAIPCNIDRLMEAARQAASQAKAECISVTEGEFLRVDTKGAWNINRRSSAGELGTWCLMQARGCADNGKAVDGTEWVREKMRQSGANESELAVIQGPYFADRPVDGDLDMILFKRPESGYAGGLVRFTAHAVICSGGYWRPNLGRDYPGRLCDLLSDEFGCPILFVQGPAADHRPRHRFCGPAERDRIAEGLAGEILNRRTIMRRFSCDTIESAHTTVECPLRPDLPVSQSAAQVELVKVRERKAHLRHGTLDALRLRKELSELEKYYDRLANLDFFWNYVRPIEHARKQAVLPVSLWGIPGGFRVLQFPGELAAAALGDFPRASGNTPLVITSYTDGVAGYILPEAYFKEGGYEVTAALLAPETTASLTKAAVSLLSCVTFSRSDQIS